MKEGVEKSLDSELWNACAGGMVHIPRVNSKVFYFPQGHAEHALTGVDFTALPRIPPLILCRVTAVTYLADPETDEVYTKINLIPIENNEDNFDDDDDEGLVRNGSESNGKPTSFAKTLTQSDANNGGGFSVPRYCAETIFPQLDYTADPPVQTVIAKDVHGEAWKFRHIYRGTPRRHLLTTGWSNFVNQKKLVAGDSVVFLRAENGDLCVGIRRAKKGCGIGGHESSASWNSSYAGNYGRFSAFLNEDDNRLRHRGCSTGNLRQKRVSPESVLEAAFLVANGQSFEVIYYPSASTPEFCVMASSVSTAMRIQWRAGMRFKMPFETEDSSRIGWFMGTIASVQVADPIHWPNSIWRLLQVKWDEPDLLQKVKCVSPWLVELVSSMPAIHLSTLSPLGKRLRSPHDLEFTLDGQFLMPSFSGNPLGSKGPMHCLSDKITAGIQGARHAHNGIPLLDLHLDSKLQLRPLAPTFQHLDKLAKISYGNENVSLSMGSSFQKSENTDNVKIPQFLLFGQPILTEQQISDSNLSPQKTSFGKTASRTGGLAPGRHSFPENFSSGLRLDSGHCKVFLESENVGRTLDLSVLRSYEELYKMLENMFGIESSEILSNTFYHDAAGAVKLVGDEPFSDFRKVAKRLTIFMNSSDCAERKLVTCLPSGECGLESSNPAGPLSIFA